MSQENHCTINFCGPGGMFLVALVHMDLDMVAADDNLVGDEADLINHNPLGT